MTINLFKSFLSLFVFIFLFTYLTINAQNELCLDCHSDVELTIDRSESEISAFIDSTIFSKSIHYDLECTDCHSDFDPDEIPHKEGERIYKVDCGDCHDVDEFEVSIHGEKKVDCFSCHGKHNIQSAQNISNDKSKLCYKCHNLRSIKKFKNSIHSTSTSKDKPVCIDCHGSDTHNIKSAKTTKNNIHEVCSKCHQKQVTNFNNSLHGEALKSEKFLAPDCFVCHDSHGMLSHNNPIAKTYVMNIPSLCGQCHKDGTDVSTLKSISQRHILKDYSESIHGDGLFKRGLIVSAVCTNCHFTHNILHHENEKSSINKKNIASTCMQCHAQIEAVHTKIIEGRLWEEKPHLIPACIDCHKPHEVRRVFYDQDYADKLCISCHVEKNVYKLIDGKKKLLKVNIDQLKNSVHKENSCIKCHTNVSTSNYPICLNSGKVDCSICHADQVNTFNKSQHNLERLSGNENAPDCSTCHGDHGIASKAESDSPIFATNIPTLCGKCHFENGSFSKTYKGIEHEIVKNYSMSIHGQGLIKSGLIVTATCIDCHTSHGELPADNPASSVSRNNIPETCSKCHLGIYEQFEKSVHSPLITKTDKLLPECSDCHSSHSIERVDEEDFRKTIMNQCGKCHQDVAETYFDTFHGKVSKLGSIKTAKCHDCHGSHFILPPDNPESQLSHKNVVNTCMKCHPNSNHKFVGYLTHATHHDKDKYPFLYYTFWGMTFLLIGTFTFFGLHTLLWLPKALSEKKRLKKKHQNMDEE